MPRALDVARRSVLLSQGVFFLPLAVCVAVVHTHAANLDGISYYGVHLTTLPIISVAYLGAAYFLWRAGTTLLDGTRPREFAWGLRLVAVSLPALLATPYSAGPWWNWSHMVIGVLSALIEFGLAIDLVIRDARGVSAVAGLVQLIGGLVAAASLPNWNFPYLLWGEIAFELGFAAVMMRWLSPEWSSSRRMAR